MKLKRLTIAGFRGFNTERSIDFHEKLTIIAAPNSHGKTSISEAMEFLLYGATSKVEKADSKEEYKDSYRNRHFPVDKPAHIDATFGMAENAELRLRVEIDTDATIRRFVDGKFVENWPFHGVLLSTARPFVLQHALKYLLLVPPSERFQGFARLIGLNAIDDTFQALISLCTKPTVSLPPEGQQILNGLETLEARVKTVPELKKVATSLKRGVESVVDTYSLIEDRVDAILGGKIDPKERRSKLIAARTAAAAKVYSGDVAIHAYSEIETRVLAKARNTLSTETDDAFIADYGKLCVHGVTTRLQKEASLLKIGVELIKDAPDSCPLCTQPLNNDLRRSIHERHDLSKAEIEKGDAREESRPRVNRSLVNVRRALEEHAQLSERLVGNIITSMLPENASKVCELLGGTDTATAETVRSAAKAADVVLQHLRANATRVQLAIDSCESQMKESHESLVDVEVLVKALQDYLVAADEFVEEIGDLEPSLVGPTKLFRQAVDALAGTSEMTLLNELLEKRITVNRSLRVRDVVEGLKELKKHVEQTLAETMEAAMSSDLTAAVMKWYEKIRTDGDPDVHFSGFAMERTKGGDFKSRRLSVRARSYGVELASAVSSLSESKLNALGLCVSIATAIRSPGPWGFLIIDDPIQSWDDEHETRFIDVIRNLVEIENKQIVVLSHKGTWAKQVCQGCRTLNGIHYEITGYAKDGPHITAMDWSPIDQRLREAEAITNDIAATSVKLQQAEEEVRLAACQAASQVAKEKLGRTTSAHNMNSKDVRAILVEAGATSDLVDRISAMFVTADDAHHAPKNYTPNPHRIRQAIASIRDALKLTKK
ncbi:MAG TPA: ATP-binding protein [Verrucomicrobiae bacterium]|nr:ATP-binding protein [Verrucomicrobiae bacterium]